MRKLIEVVHSSLIDCDNPKCSFSIPYDEQLDRELHIFINRTCPECHENLLTRADYLQYKKFMNAIDWANKWFSWLTIFSFKKRKRGSVSVNVREGIRITDDQQQ